jgi:hypothetical protein
MSLVMDPLNYASVNLSTDVFDGALATLGLNRPMKNYVLLNFDCYATFVYTMGIFIAL